MDIIDEKGRLFGVVNIIDALVVLLVLAVGVAGVALVQSPDEPTQQTGPGEEDNVTQYATIDIGNERPFVVEHIAEGDVLTAKSGENLTVTDVYVGPGKGTNARTLLRAEVSGPLEEGQQWVTVGESPLAIGRTVTMTGQSYATKGTVVALDTAGDHLAVEETQVVVEAVPSTSIAEQLQPGDVYRLGGRPVVRIESVTAYPTGNPDRTRVFLGLTVNTFERANVTYAGNRWTKVGGKLSLHFTDTALSGTIVRRGTTELPGESATRTATIELRNVRPEAADDLSAGLTETSRGETLARIVNVSTAPATVTVQSDDGHLYLREHPQNVDVTLTVTLATRETDGEVWFRGTRLQEGGGITLDFTTTTVNGVVTDIEQG